MKVFWRRGKETLSFTRPKTYFTLGQIGTGKSTLLQNVGIQHHKQGGTVLDLYASADGENLAWLRSDIIKDKNVLLLKGENVDVETVHDVKLIENLGLHDLEKYDFIISSRPLYLNRDHEFFAVGKLVELLYKRLHWRRLLCMIAREASSLWYSRIKVSNSQGDAKNEALYMFREMRHLGVSLALDSLRLQGIDIDLRSHTDFLFIKAQGIDGLSSNLSFLYSFFDPKWIRSMKPWEFALVCRSGSLGVGHFPYHEWHKIEKENIVKAVGLKIEYGAELEQPKDMGDFKTVGDAEHMQMMLLYAEGNGYAKIHDKLNRSTKTIFEHVHKHNNGVGRSGFCVTCRRGGGEYSGKIVKKGCSIQ